MKSEALPSFWETYYNLDSKTRMNARKAYRLWLKNPFHPSLHFKCIHQKESIWAVRISRGCRALGIMSRDTMTWFWVGDHDAYERFFS